MGSSGTIALFALAGVSSFALFACEPAPSYDEWMAAYVPHGPLEPTSEVAALEQLTHSAYDEMFQSLSPDGATLLYVSGWFYPDHSIEGASLVGLNPRSPTSTTTFAGGAGFALTPAWLPDGSGYLYATNANGPWQLVRSLGNGPDAGHDVILTGDETKPLHPTVSPDGLRFAYSMTQAGARHVAVANIDGTESRVLVEGDYPSWSPAGDEIVFQRVDAYGRTQLFAVGVDGGEAQQRTFGDTTSIHPSHDPTGAFVVFGSTRGHEQHLCKVCCGLYVMNADGSNVVELVGGDVDADWPSWGSDGWIYFASNERGSYDVWRVRVGEGSSRVPAVPTVPTTE